MPDRFTLHAASIDAPSGPYPTLFEPRPTVVQAHSNHSVASMPIAYTFGPQPIPVASLVCP
eukprot:2079619-Alexandrium_andersonii.AAC.1